MTERAPMPFVVGSVRSGTTLCWAMLDAHPDLAMGFESYFLLDAILRRPRWGVGDHFDPHLLVNYLLHASRGEKFRQRWQLDPASVHAAVTAPEVRSLEDAVRSLYALLAEGRGATRWGEKTAGYLVGLPAVAEALPEARFVHVVRDGRDAAISHASRRWGPDDLAGATAYWAERVTRLRALGQDLGTRRYLEVRYEDLVEDTAAVLRRVCQHVDLDLHPAMLAHHEVEGGVVDRLREAVDHQHAMGPVRRGLRSWRRDLAPNEVEAAERPIADVLCAFGYDLATQPSTGRP